MNRIHGLKEYTKGRKYRDAIEIPLDAEVNYTLLAQGEYNINYLFVHPVSGKKLLLRVNCGSQMHLEKQIEYEFGTLKQLEASGRTPKPLWVDGSMQELGHGVLVMEFLEGRVLDYRTDLNLAAECLADIHSLPIKDPKQLRSPEHPLEAILEECEEMITVYNESSLAEEAKKVQIRRMMDKMWVKARVFKGCGERYKCCINTELNSTNFLMNGPGADNYLIDWEKPLYGVVAQDLGHFLAPTTTFWKTDVILTKEEAHKFMETYKSAVRGRFDTFHLQEDVDVFLPVTCMRGITWCAMAWVQYQQPDKLIFNESTFRKLNAYISQAFLDEIEARL